MSAPYLTFSRLERKRAIGEPEALQFDTGVNLLVGRPNTGKTKWLQMLDYLLGDPGEQPFDSEGGDGLSEKYESAAVEIGVGEERLKVERRWREPGSKTKIFVDGVAMPPRDFQDLLLRKLAIPILSFPKGNPMSGQTWPELSFRMLLRHIHRQQRFWSGIADLQPDGEQHACILQFLGLAERLFTNDYGLLVRLKMEAEHLKARREEHSQTLNELAREVLSQPGLALGANEATVREAELRLASEIEDLRRQRIALIEGARDSAVPSEARSNIDRLVTERSRVFTALEALRQSVSTTRSRLDDVRRYRGELSNELDRLQRAEDAGRVLNDLKITHCPACDQPVSGDTEPDDENCFLCHQNLPNELVVEELGVVRLRFERDRLVSEFKESEELLGVLQRELAHVQGEARAAEEQLRMLENELAPTRQAVAGLIQADVSALDMALGERNERQRQLSRIKTVLDQGRELTEKVSALEAQVATLQSSVDEATRGTDFSHAAGQLEDGMNSYLEALNTLRPGTWRSSSVRVDLSRSAFSIRVGPRRWHDALGGTNTLYFLMAYHYGLLSLSTRPGCHYPGLSIIDIPAEFSGEAVEDKENFIVQPFIDLLTREGYRDAQVIVTGASFAGLGGTNRVPLTELFVA